MCYAIPGRVTAIEGDEAVVDYGGVTKRANISLIENVKRGDFVLIHAGFAIEKVAQHTAEESLAMIRNYIDESEKGMAKERKNE